MKRRKEKLCDLQQSHLHEKEIFQCSLKSGVFMCSMKIWYIAASKSFKFRGFKSLCLDDVTRPWLSGAEFIAELCKQYSRKWSVKYLGNQSLELRVDLGNVSEAFKGFLPYLGT